MKNQSFTIKNPITHPFFFWPETLVSFESKEKIFALRDEKGKLYTCQNKNGRVYFKTSLGAGESKTFVPEKAVPKQKMEYSENEDFYIVNNMNFLLLIPKKQKVKNNSTLLFELNGEFKTSAAFTDEAKEYKLEITDKGDVFFKAKITLVGDNYSYSVDVCSVLGYDFINLDEKFNNTNGKQIKIETCNLKPEKWYATTWPDDYWATKSDKYGDYEWRSTSEPIVIPFNGEDPAFFDVPNDDKAFKVRFGSYVPFFAYSVRPCASFWNNNGSTLGFFVSNHENWEEGSYTLWGSGEDMDGRFYYENEVFCARFNLCGKTRSMAVCVYNRSKDEWWFETLKKLSDEAVLFGVSPEEAKKLTCFPTTYTAFLHNRYAVINLESVKSWQLEYSGKIAEIPYDENKAKIKSADELKRLVYSMGRAALATKGTEEFHERNYTFEAVEMRMVYDKLLCAYVRFKDELKKEDEKNVTAMLLMTIYVCAGECVMPIKKILGGHPNFLADVKSVAGFGAAVFPEHKDAKYFADVFSEYIEKNTKYNIRPAVEKWDARGGRWTEAPGIYTWAFLTPSLLANHSIKRFYDGKERMSNPYLAQLARWLMNYTTPPIEGRRKCLPIGAHSALRNPFRVFELLADSLRENYPEVAANIEYLSEPNDRHIEALKNEEDVWEFLYKEEKGERKMPELVSAKYTGCGLVFRNNVGNKNESAVFLQQVDDGPNYRWGLAAQGSCGALYYYANGKAFSHSGKEDTGDRKFEDTVYMTNFGVWKDGMYKSVGKNELCEPMYNLGFVQYGKILASLKYSAPEYKSKSVMVFDDYFVVYDSVLNNWVHTRFSWFCPKDGDFPEIRFVRGFAPDRFGVKDYGFSEHTTAETKGRWYEGIGTSMCVVSSDEVEVKKQPWGATVKQNEHIFMLDKEEKISFGQIEFFGDTGYAKTGENVSLALFNSGEISFSDFKISCSSAGCAVTKTEEKVFGYIYSQNGGKVSICALGSVFEKDFIGRYEIKIENGKMTAVKLEDNYPVFPNKDEFIRNTIYVKGELKY